MIELPKHIHLAISHNAHAMNYETVEQYLMDDDHIDFRSAESRQQCIDQNEIWEVQWYPSTPIGFYCVGAPTLGEALDLALDLALEAER